MKYLMEFTDEVTTIIARRIVKGSNAHFSFLIPKSVRVMKLFQ
jgi:hypothetical protein